MRHAAAVPALALLAGSAAGLLFPSPHTLICAFVMLAACACAVFAWITGRTLLIAASAAAGFAAGGAMLSSAAWQRAWRPPLRLAFEQFAAEQRARAAVEGRRLPEDPEAFAMVEGVLRADAAVGPTGVSLSAYVDGARPIDGDARMRTACTGGVIVTVIGALALDHAGEWRAGRRVRMPVLLRRPARYLDPGVPDFERALARRGTTLVGTVKSGALVEVLARGSPVDEALGAVRAFARQAIAASVGRWDAQSAAIVSAIVIGDRTALSDEVQRELQDAGTYHVIAISGGNIAILAGLLIGAFRMAGWLGRGAMLSAIVLLAAYERFVGGGASVDRATLMAVVYFAARMIDQRSPPLNVLALVAAILVARDPLTIVDPGFLLTCGATLAILVLLPIVDAWPVPRVFRAMAATVAASIGAEALLFPVGALLFSRVTFAGLALNLAAIPLMAVAQVAGMLVVPAAWVSLRLAAVPGWIAYAGAAGLVQSAGLVRYAPAVAYRVAAPAPLACIIYYFSLGAAWALWRRRVLVVGSGEPPVAGLVRRLAILAAAASAAWILVDPQRLLASRGDRRLHVTFVDVGQGDAIFVRFPAGSTLLVDAGGLGPSSTFDIGDRVVAPALRTLGVSRLGALALTHGDPDHIGGAPAIVREFRPREVWEGIPVPPFDPLTRLRVQSQSTGARWANVYRGDRVTIDDVAVKAHHPERADWERQKVRNDDSLVLELRWRDVSVVLTGDIGRIPERPIAATFRPAKLRIVKIPHHGSLTSSTPEFIAALKPTIAIASAGRANHFGHPVPEVLDRYRAAGADVFRTDQDGAVMVDTDGWSVHVTSVAHGRGVDR